MWSGSELKFNLYALFRNNKLSRRKRFKDNLSDGRRSNPTRYHDVPTVHPGNSHFYLDIVRALRCQKGRKKERKIVRKKSPLVR